MEFAPLANLAESTIISVQTPGACGDARGHDIEQLHGRGTEPGWRECPQPSGEKRWLYEGWGSQLPVEGKEKGCRNHEELGGGTWHVNSVLRARTGDVMWAFKAGKEGDSEPMKRTIFCGAQEGPLMGDFLRRAPGLGCLPRERWCLSWGSCTLPSFSSVTNGAHSRLWHCRSP